MSVGKAQIVPAESAADPSMEDILASIRRILADDEVPENVIESAAVADDPPAHFASAAHDNIDDNADEEDVLVLDQTMMVVADAMPVPPRPVATAPLPPKPSPPIAPSEPPYAAPAPADSLIAGATETAAVAAVSQLMRSLHTERLMPVYRGGPTLEDLALEALRPMLKLWLDQNLPPMVERLVRNEIERVVAKAAG